MEEDTKGECPSRSRASGIVAMTKLRGGERLEKRRNRQELDRIVTSISAPKSV